MASHGNAVRCSSGNVRPSAAPIASIAVLETAPEHFFSDNEIHTLPRRVRATLRLQGDRYVPRRCNMARLEQHSASPNAKRPMDSAPMRETVHPTRSGVLPMAGILTALAIAIGAFFYYQGELDEDSATSAQVATADKTVSAPTGATPLNAGATSSSAQSKTGAASATPSVHANAAAPHRLAKATRAVEPRDRQVFLTIRPQPVYPVQALRAGEEGTVRVLAQVNVDGQVTDARVIRHSGSSILDRAAPNEVRHWKFEPALHDGRPVVASIEVPVSYRLNK